MAADTFTEREKDMMAFAWQCFDDEPKVTFPPRRRPLYNKKPLRWR